MPPFSYIRDQDWTATLPMRDTKLLQQLFLLSEHDRKQFSRYLASPIFQVQARTRALFEVIEQHLLRYKQRDLTEEEVAALMFPGEAYDKNRFRKECTALLKRLHGFWAFQAFQSDPQQHGVYLLSQLNALGEGHYFPYYAEDVQAELAAPAEPDAQNFGRRIAVGMEQFKFDLRHAGRNSDVDLGQLIDHAELAYCCTKMQLLYLELNHRKVTGKGQPRGDEAFLALVQAHLERLPSLTRMYYHLYQCTADPNAEGDYQQFRELLALSGIEGTHAEEMYTAALNYCARKLNAGGVAVLREMLELYQEMLGKGLFESTQNLLSPQFKNVVVVASRLREFAWAQAFVARFELRLLAERQGNAVQFGHGVIAYFEGKFGKAEPCFHRVLDDFDDIHLGLDARVYLLRIYLETENVIGLDSLADSFRMYLKRQSQLPGSRKANYNTFIRFIRRLAHTPAHDRAALEKLLAAIQSSRKIAVTDWLIQKVQAKIAGIS